MAPNTPPDPPPPVDFAGTPLHVGDRVAFIRTFDNQPALYNGSIALVGKEQVCVQSGNLHVVSGQRQKPAGKPECIRYETIIRRPETEDEA